MTDPFRFDLDVHRAIGPGAVGLSALPAYVERDHDRAEPWRLWHPIEPSRPEGVLADLANSSLL
ncbi:hypothetical protein AB0L53_51950 [Nonomuraea sp. NPDC052129]|uniref:hypothetical protein n=1 Tax=unclassified Nonomuraea TaxID=2593643 RepID=UPI0033CDE07B